MAAGESYYRFESAGSCSIITLLPELNDKQWADIEKVGTEIVERLGAIPSPRLVVDLTPLSYMGSAMVALIVRLYKTVNSRSGQMVVVNTNPMVFEVLKLAGLTKLWTIVDGREKGFAALGVKVRAGADSSSPATQGNAAVILGIIGTIGAVLALALQFSRQPIVPQKIALLIEFAFAAMGIAAGTMIAVNQVGARRNVGIAFLGVCLMVVLGGILAAPDQAPTAAPASSAGTKSSATSSNAVDTEKNSPPVDKQSSDAKETAAKETKTATGASPAETSGAPANKSPKKRKDK